MSYITEEYAINIVLNNIVEYNDSTHKIWSMGGIVYK